MLISFIVIEFHSVNDIIECIRSIHNTVTDCDYEIIVSSNSLYDERRKKEILELLPGDDVLVLFNERNGGFAYAMNRGLERAKGDLLAIVNPDCVFIKGMKEMADFLIANKKLGAIAPRMTDRDGNLQDSAREYVTPFRFAVRQMKRVLGRKEVVLSPSMDYSQLQTVDWVIGAFMLVSREAYVRTGGMADTFFMYAEDLDWCTRIREAGFEICYYPDAEIQYRGTRRARKSGKYSRIFIQSHLRFWRNAGWMASMLPRRTELKDL